MEIVQIGEGSPYFFFNNKPKQTELQIRQERAIMCHCPWMDGGVGNLGDTAAKVTHALVIAQITSWIHQELLG